MKEEAVLVVQVLARNRSVVRTRSRISECFRYPRWWPIERLVKPNPVAAMLDIVRESLPFERARSLTCPVLELASFQKKSKVARSISSSSCSSVPSNGAPLGGTKDGEACF